MKFYQKWLGTYIKDGIESESFPCNVSGNIQLDYSEFVGFGDVNYCDNCEKFRRLRIISGNTAVKFSLKLKKVNVFSLKSH